MKFEKLGNLIKIISGFAFESALFNNDGQGLPLIRVRDVNSGFSGLYYSGNYDENYIINNSDLLIGLDGDFRCVEWNDGKALLNQRVCKIIPNLEKIDKTYLLHFLPEALNGIHKNTNFTTVKHLSTKTILEIEIPILPLSDQLHIANILTQAENLIAQRKESIRLLDEFLKSTFLEMFGDPVRNEKGWKANKLKEVCIKITDGTHFSPPIVNKGIPYITAKHVRADKIDFWSNPWFIDEVEHRNIYKRCNPQKGDVLYIKDGATTGYAAINKYDFEFSMLSSLALLKTNKEKCNSEYLCSWLNNPFVKNRILQGMSGGAIQRLTLTKINELRINLPPIALQTQFAQIVEKTEALKTQYQQSLQELESLYGSLSQSAFKGELTAKDGEMMMAAEEATGYRSENAK